MTRSYRVIIFSDFISKIDKMIFYLDEIIIRLTKLGLSLPIFGPKFESILILSEETYAYHINRHLNEWILTGVH